MRRPTHFVIAARKYCCNSIQESFWIVRYVYVSAQIFDVGDRCANNWNTERKINIQLEWIHAIAQLALEVRHDGNVEPANDALCFFVNSTSQQAQVRAARSHLRNFRPSVGRSH